MSTSMDGEDDEDSQDELSEIEARLYSIVHYNDLSKPLDESIASQYDIEVTADQQVIVTLKGQPDEGGEASEAKRQKLSEFGGSGDCVTNQKNNQSSTQSDGILGEINKGKNTSQTKTLVDIDKGDGDVVVVTVEDSEGLNNSRSDTNPPKPDETSNHQRFDPTVDTSVSNKGNISFNGRITPGKKKKIRKRGRKKDNEWIVDLTSDNDDSDCLVVSDEKKCNVEDDALVLNVLGDDEIVDENSLSTTNNSEEKIVEGEKSAERVGGGDVSGENVANGSVERERVKSTKKQRRSKIKMKRKSFNCPKTWTASMVKFYCKTSKLRENFNHDTLLVKMRASNIPRDKWVVSKVDKRPPNNRLSHTRCDRCRQFGHVSRFCIEPVKPIICYMCGGHGHRESRCPERKCLNCGRESDIYVEMCAECHSAISEGILYCAICNSLTHHTNLCPNLWRAFHMTTTSGPLMVPHNDMGRRKLHCSNCACEGHMFHECRNTFHVTPFALCAVSPVVPDYSRIAQHFAQLRGDRHLCIALQLRNDQYQRLASAEGCSFLQELSDTENVTLRMQEQSLTIEGEHKAYYPMCRAVAMFLAQGNCETVETVSLLE